MKKTLLAVITLTAALLCTGCAGSAGAVADENSGIPTAEQIAAVKDALGENMNDLKFSVDGKVYQYPMIMQDMQDNGWYIDNSIANKLKTLEANTRTATFVLRKNREKDYGITACYVVAENTGISEKEISETNLSELSFYREKGATIILGVSQSLCKPSN
ncbi:MAG: hypothetical protein J6C84_03390 [Lachnospiraceae bacterium]|nr:hypothetical protein [Lachnospiraceae bacterium]MBO5070599.1 hypothetical protein [Roseburia sp.]